MRRGSASGSGLWRATLRRPSAAPFHRDSMQRSREFLDIACVAERIYKYAPFYALFLRAADICTPDFTAGLLEDSFRGHSR
mmetsp:Transcript_1748/g.3673  ORF Transcript_1748/g.3673 Transcript_1748/m.3673 type:complete len:81 (+) Transcript_1748:1414-1656(+)|eukprot:5883491-Pleurochrysis_carterae.AAC.3